MAIAACDSGPPTATLYEPNARWLHDTVSIGFDQRIGYGGSSLYAGGVRVASGNGLTWNGDGDTWTTLAVPSTLDISGSFRLEVRGWKDGHSVEPDTFEWELATWTVDELPGDEPPTGPPQIVELASLPDPFLRTASRNVVVLWPTDSGLRAVTRNTIGAWRDADVLRDDFGEPVVVPSGFRVATGAYGQIFLAWGTGGFAMYTSDAYGYGGWDAYFERPSVGAEPSITASPYSTIALAGVLDGAVAIARGVPAEEGLEWTTASLPVASIVGRPAIALVGYEDTPFVAYLDATAEGTKLRVAAWYEGAWTTLGEADVAAPIGDPALVTYGDNTVVAWNDGGAIATARVGFAGWRDWPSPGTSDAAPDLAGARTGRVAISLLDDSVASTLHWDGESWSPLGDPWLDGGTPSTSSTAVWAGRVPMTAWLEDGAVRVALYNGETP